MARKPTTPPLVFVQWLHDAGPGTAGEHSCYVGDRHYQGRVGQRERIRSDDAQALADAGFVEVVARQGTATSAT